jgi:addiction module HigA family antidote
MGKMHNPPHPGEALKDSVFVDTAVTVTAAAKALGVTRAALSRVLNGKAAVSADMALRLAQWTPARKSGSTCRPPMTCGRPGRSLARRSNRCTVPRSDRRPSLKNPL